ncbi:MAG: hypothetical protein ACREM6_06295 [Vulcanimicrobiaceae bacterium]
MPTLNKLHMSMAAAVAAAAIAGCSQSSQEPKITGTVNPLTQTTLQFAVGTANIAGTVGLNSVETFRQNAGADVGASILANAPTIVGPAGFLVPKQPDAFTDGGTNSITGSLETNIGVAPPQTTFDPPYSNDPNSNPLGLNGLASSYGILPATVGNASAKPNLFPYSLPFYTGANPTLSLASTPTLPCYAPPMGAPATAQYCYVGGPPAFVPKGHTSTQDGTFNGGDPGFVLGFVDFQAVPVAGTYTLNVTVPTALNPSNGQPTFGVKTATSNLGSTTALPAWTTPPTFMSDGTGGGTITTNFAGGGGVTEEYLELVNTSVFTAKGAPIGNVCQLSGLAPYYYTFEVPPGTATVTVPDNLGAAPPGKTQPHTLCTAAENTNGGTTPVSGDGYAVYGFAVDYPLIESAFPASQGQTAPTIAGTGGQADVTTSIATVGNE